MSDRCSGIPHTFIEWIGGCITTSITTHSCGGGRKKKYPHRKLCFDGGDH